MNKLNVCWSNVYRKIFGLIVWESVKLIQLFCGRLDLTRIFHQRKIQFFTKLINNNNIVLQSCFKVGLCNNKVRALCNEYHIVIDKAVHVGQSVSSKFTEICKWN